MNWLKSAFIGIKKSNTKLVLIFPKGSYFFLLIEILSFLGKNANFTILTHTSSLGKILLWLTRGTYQNLIVLHSAVYLFTDLGNCHYTCLEKRGNNFFYFDLVYFFSITSEQEPINSLLFNPTLSKKTLYKSQSKVVWNILVKSELSCPFFCNVISLYCTCICFSVIAFLHSKIDTKFCRFSKFNWLLFL